MKRSNYILPVLGLCILTISVWAQNRKPTEKTKPQQQPASRVKTTVPVFLGSSRVSGGIVSKPAFDSLVLQGLRSDSGRVVAGFKFSYAEHNLYEDSVGNLVNLVDYNSEYCFGDTLGGGIKAGLRQRSKAGDTAYFENIDVKLPGGGMVEGQPMKIVIK